MDGSSDLQLRRALLNFVEQDSVNGAEDSVTYCNGSAVLPTEERQAGAATKAEQVKIE